MSLIDFDIETVPRDDAFSTLYVVTVNREQLLIGKHRMLAKICDPPAIQKINVWPPV